MPKQKQVEVEEKRTKVSQSEFPNNTLEQALRVAQAIWDNFAGKGAPPHQIALAMDISPTSSAWRNLCGSSIAYGLTDGGYNASQITLTELGRRVVAPTVEGGDIAAKVEALLKPRVSREFYSKYDRAKFPKDEIGRNVLVELGLPKDRADRSFEILKSNGEYAGVILSTRSGPFVAMDSRNSGVGGGLSPASTDDFNSHGAPDPASELQSAASAGRALAPDTPKQLFVAHGKNRKPLESLRKVLNEFKIPYKVAVDEPNVGRPISAKVAELMRECSAGVFIFTRDEKFLKEDKDQKTSEVWRPSENVVYELGAASILWERKIIILREEGVNFPSDFSDLGYITFKDGELESKALELLKELVALGLVKFQAA
jgi:predicted nucleotide-binding protein